MDHSQPDTQAAEEAWSETFLKVVRARQSYSPEGNFRAWVITIARRCAQDSRRRQRRWIRLLTHRKESTSDQPMPVEPPENLLLRGERIAAVKEALQVLSEEHRSIVLLTYQQDLSSVEVADILGLTSQQVRSRLTYARRLLDAQIQPA